MTSLYGTLAHEMQHLINHVVTKGKRTFGMDTWIDEGLSTSSEYIWTGSQSTSRISYYNTDSSGGIQNGNNFFVWGNAGRNILDEYSTVYLFFQWLRIHAQNDMEIYKKILYASDSDYRAVTKAAIEQRIIAGSGNPASDWSLLLRNWLAANFINASTGLYGYKSQISLSPKIKTGSGSNTGFQLLPGEAIYSVNPNMPAASGFIKYAGLPARGSTAAPNETSSATSSVMLSYNINTNNSNSAATCYPYPNVMPVVPGFMSMQFNETIGEPFRLPDTYPVSREDYYRDHTLVKIE